MHCIHRPVELYLNTSQNVNDMIATKTGRRASKPRLKVHDYLIYEIIDGQPIHYKGYRDIAAGAKNFSDIRGASKLQSNIAGYLMRVLFKSLNEDEYVILSCEQDSTSIDAITWRGIFLFLLAM